MSLQEKVSRILNDGVANSPFAGAVYSAVDRDGHIIVEEAAGLRALGCEDKMTMHTIFPIFSTTKTITCIAWSNAGSSPSTRRSKKIVPEFAQIRVLQGDGTLKPAQNKITLRMLLAHTLGHAYGPTNDNLRKHLHIQGSIVPEFSGKRKDLLDAPLIYEPGTSWEYGVGLDWAGEVISRVSGLTLGQYFEENIYQPLGVRCIYLYIFAALVNVHRRYSVKA
ncbi:beta-lactamase/transpeptidase-like protein [Exidia glandulosa HHB12029]|uniref:Beta-lactamase/transpeptidase-like protein n=1 Tax=Exidia glandulosa HHB12029 TaxID=1314781 RepID=A0A165EAV5_EXIGL|nr:beta-lactamase/transpeptidase-like protein [Exidia glandulosa HHB12029]